MVREEAKDLLFSFMPKGMTMNSVCFIETIDEIYDGFDKQLLKKDIEIARLEGMLKAMNKEVYKLHPDDCNCMTCEEQRNDKPN